MSSIGRVKQLAARHKNNLSGLLIGRIQKEYSIPDTEEAIKLIEQSGLFDGKYYLKNNPDVADSGMEPLLHYVLHGGEEGRQPSEKFDSQYYLTKYADVREMRVNPLLHYIVFGRKDSRAIAVIGNKGLSKKSSSKSKQVDIINVNFYDWDGEVLYKGGAERYVYDLACILLNDGYEPRILQNANKSFKKKYRGIEVVGIETGAKDASGQSLRIMSKAFNEQTSNSRMVIASPLDLACEITNQNVIGINHGIHWDSKFKHLYNNRTSDYSEIFDALSRISMGICVDTNFINWTRTYDYELGSKLKFIPNYYDKNSFHSTKKDFNKRLKIMYPRRLYDARGIYITLDAFDILLSKYKDMDLLLVGQTTDKDVIREVSRMQKKYKTQVSLEEFDMDDMYKAYQKSNVVLIPTRYAEGTSLSALEAMATNNTLIVTNIGGLPNLVIDGYNGLLIDPTSDALVNAIEKIATDREYAEQLAGRGVELSSVFEKNHWDEKWKDILKELL